MASGGSAVNGLNEVDFVRKPSFMKSFSGPRDANSLRLPREWVQTHGDELPHICTLVMPSGEWRVRLLNVASGCQFCNGWSDFVRHNRIGHKESLVFTMVSEGIFIVQSYDSGSGCPPREEYDSEVGEFGDAVLLPDIDSEDDYSLPDDGSKDDSGAEYFADPSLLFGDAYPSFNVALTQTSIDRTLEIPMSFWKTYLCMADLDGYVYFMVEDKTWVVQLECDNKRIWVKHGWRRFKDANALVKGVVCNFLLVNMDEVQFYVTFSR